MSPRRATTFTLIGSFIAARLNAIAHILSQIPYKKVDHPKVKLPARSDKKKYDDRASIAGRRRVEQRY